MASVPADPSVSKLTLARTERVDDIARLKQELGLPGLNYVDISAEAELKRALQRWPLLAELEGANVSTSFEEVT